MMMENEPAHGPTEDGTSNQNANLEGQSLPPKAPLVRKCYECGKTSKLTLHQARLAKSGNLVSRCHRVRLVPTDRLDMRQKAALEKKARARKAALPVTEEMVRDLLRNHGRKLEKMSPLVGDSGAKIPDGWRVLEEQSFFGMIWAHCFRNLGEAYLHAREVAGLSTDLEVIEREFGLGGVAK